MLVSTLVGLQLGVNCMFGGGVSDHRTAVRLDRSISCVVSVTENIQHITLKYMDPGPRIFKLELVIA